MTDQSDTPGDAELLDHEKVSSWPPLKKALWDVVTGEQLNDGHYINAYHLTDKLYEASAALSRAPEAAGYIYRTTTYSSKLLKDIPAALPARPKAGSDQ